MQKKKENKKLIENQKENVSIIIIAGTFDESIKLMTQACIDSFDNAKGSVHIIVVETYNVNINYINCETIYYIKEKFNYNEAVNFGIKHYEADIYGFFNNDIIASENWLPPILEALKIYDSVSCFCPISFEKTDKKYLEGYTVRKQIAGWAILAKKEALVKIGLLHNQVSFWQSDNVYGQQLKKHGLKHALVTDSIITHLNNGSNTLNKILDKSEINKMTFAQHDIIKRVQSIHNYRFSVIMPVTLKEYPKCAKNRRMKFIRAVESCLNQTFKNFELIIISDGCDETIEVYRENFAKYNNVLCLKIPKQPDFSGLVRQVGVNNATGEYIIYLDSDDIYQPEHLETVDKHLNNVDWMYFNDWKIDKNGKTLHLNQVDLIASSLHTSAFCHKRMLQGVTWDFIGYCHDNYFAKKLMNYKSKKMPVNSGYVIMHTPNSGIDI